MTTAKKTAPKKAAPKAPVEAPKPQAQPPAQAPRNVPKLTGSQIRYLRGLGHSLDPVMHVGKDGVTESLVRETQNALARHELVKVRVQSEAPEGRKETAEDLAQRAGAVLAQVLGRTLLLYRRHPKNPKIAVPGMAPLPSEKTTGPSKKNRRTGRSKPKSTTRAGTASLRERVRANEARPGGRRGGRTAVRSEAPTRSESPSRSRGGHDDDDFSDD